MPKQTSSPPSSLGPARDHHRANTWNARALLARAAEWYDVPEHRLQAATPSAAWGGFASGAEWMGLALQVMRAESPTRTPSASRFCYQVLGLIKYGLASCAALVWLGAVLLLDWPILSPLAIAIFYAVEAQMVFLFPLALDGSSQPFREARRWTVYAGGTLPVMRVVLPLAGGMLFGGFIGRGFVRSWCLGCLAVCLWYETIRKNRLDGVVR